MRVLNDEVPDDGDFDAGRSRGEFDHITPEDITRGTGNPPGWLGADDIADLRSRMPIAYVEIVPVRVAGRVLYHESLREAIARNISKDMGELALPVLPQTLTPFTVAEFFPTPGVSPYFDARQHAIALCYVVPIAGDCKPQDETLDVEWVDPHGPQITEFIEQMNDGHGTIVRQALAWVNL